MRAVTLFLKGMVVGIANVIPGVSTGTFMVLLDLYDELIEAVGNFLAEKEGRRNKLLFLIPFGVGVAVGTLAFAKLATFVLGQYPVPAQLFFIGLIAGSIPSVIKMHHDMRPSAKRVIVFAVGLGLAILVGLGARSKTLEHFSADVSSLQGLLYFGVVGFLAGGAVLTPGLSGSYIFLLAGTYEPIMQALDSLTQPPIHWGVIISTAVGAGLGILICSRLIGLALKRQPAATFYAILGLICGSFVGLWPAGLGMSTPSLVSVATLLLGAVIAYLLGRPARGRSPESRIERN